MGGMNVEKSCRAMIMLAFRNAPHTKLKLTAHILISPYNQCIETIIISVCSWLGEILTQKLKKVRLLYLQIKTPKAIANIRGYFS
ncbi:hypothetical protein QL285_073107 [Trifolium repens]|jgi:hypothetical protein|nr:hypothetical protein QL285_073107 [Trifolium repens]